MTKRQKLVREFRVQVAKANRKVKQMNKSGLRPFNMQFVKKWDLYLADRSYATQHGYWKESATNMNMKQLKEMIAILTQFNVNQYNTLDYTEMYVNELKDRTGVKETKHLKTMFKVFREYGFAGEWDSDTTLSNLGDWISLTDGDENALVDWIEQFKADYERLYQQAATTEDLKQGIKDYIAEYWLAGSMHNLGSPSEDDTSQFLNNVGKINWDNMK